MLLPMIFPGQASQYVGMGADLYEGDADSRRLFDDAEDALGFPLRRLCFEGPLEELTETRYAQPAILTVSVACLQWLGRRGIKPNLVAGHSLGEYSALVAAGVLSFTDALDLVALRGRLMFESGERNPGTMAAVIGLGRPTVDECCRQAAEGEVLQVANINSPEQLVISGAVDAVKRGCRACLDAGAKKALPLTVSGAFHSALMESAADELGARLGSIQFRPAEADLIPNVTAAVERDPEVLRDLLIRQLTCPVLWSDSMQVLAGQGGGEVVEVGPGKVLMGLMRRIDRGVKVRPLGTLESLEEWILAKEETA